MSGSLHLIYSHHRHLGFLILHSATDLIQDSDLGQKYIINHSKIFLGFKEGSGIDISAGNDWESEVPVGKGSAYGFETYFEKVFGKTLFNVNYTYSISDRLFADLNNGNIFPFNLNRNHSLKCSFNYRISQFTEFWLIACLRARRAA